MPKPYSQDLRERVVRAVEAGASCHEAAVAFEGTGSHLTRARACTFLPLHLFIRDALHCGA